MNLDAPEKSSAPGGVGEPSACREDAGTCAIGTVCSRALPARLSHPSGPATRKPSTCNPSSPLLYLYPDTAPSFWLQPFGYLHHDQAALTRCNCLLHKTVLPAAQ